MRFRPHYTKLMPLWLIPMLYTVASVAAGLILPRLEHAYFAGYTENISVGSALAFFSSVSSGMMALTGIVFALAALVWTDRGGSGRVPLFSTLLVGILLIVSMTAFIRLVQSLNDLQIHNVLQVIGTRGRSVIRMMFPLIADNPKVSREDSDAPPNLGPPTQTLTHSGEPRAITRFDLDTLVRVAQEADAVVAIECGVGDTVVEDAVLLRVYGATRKLPEQTLTRAIHLATSRSFEQDPKYAIRLLVDIAIRALSPAVNDPTTAVQALDQIEDLLRRLGCRQLEAGYARDKAGKIRVTFPVPTWQDYLALAFDEIRLFGATSIQVGRRLRASLIGLSQTIAVDERRAAVQRYLDHLNLGIARSSFDDQDRAAAQQEDRQGLGLSRRRA